MPASSSARWTSPKEAPRFMPRLSRTSALPDRLVTDRFPCLATRIPAPAATKATVVEMLKLPDRSPPVPQVSRRGSPGGAVILTAFCRITSTAAAISAVVSPFIARQERNEEICAGVASPPMIIRMASRIPSGVRSLPDATAEIASRMLLKQRGTGCRGSMRERKFSRILIPYCVRIDSGWNWTPNTGRERCRIPMTSPSSDSAHTSRTEGRDSRSTASEW